MAFVAAAAFAIKKGPALIRAGRKVLDEWNALPPEQKAMVSGQAAAVLACTAEIKKILGERTGLGGPSSDKLMAAALNPDAEFLFARSVVDSLDETGPRSAPELAADVGASGPSDPLLVGALKVALQDGYVLQARGMWRTPDPSSLIDPAKSQEVQRLAITISTDVQAFGAVGIKQLVKSLGSGSVGDPRFRSALRLLQDESKVVWGAPNALTLPNTELDNFARAALGAESRVGPKEAVSNLSDAIVALGKGIADVKSGKVQATPAGWYPNPDNPAELRWWDGSQWTNHTHVQSTVVDKDEAVVKRPWLPG